MTSLQKMFNTLRGLISFLKDKSRVKKHPIIASMIIFVTWIIAHKLYMIFYRKIKQLPNGPNGFPVVGAFLLAINKGPGSFATFLANNYSKYIVFYYLGSSKQVLINNASLAKQIFGNPSCQNRDEILCAMIANEADVLRVEYGKQWKERRKLIRSVLLVMEDSKYVDENIQIFIKRYIDPKIEQNMKQNGFIHPKELSLSIRHLAFSMILKVMFGIELSSDDPLFQQLARLYEEWSIDVGVVYFSSFLPIINYFQYKKNLKHIRELENKLNMLIKEKFFNPLIDKFDDEKSKNTYFEHTYSYINDKKLNKNNITLNQLLMDFTILIQASIDTASFVLQMGLLHLIKYKQLQKTVYDELIEIFPDKIFDLKKVICCPKFRAYTHEILRVALPVPTGVPRYTDKNIDVEFVDDNGVKQKYVLPKNSVVALNLAYMHYDNNDKWGGNAKEINLNNWLEYDEKKKGVIFKNRKDVFPFSTGFRDCVGRSLALRLLYSIFATMILKYRFDKADDDFEIKIKYSPGGSPRIGTDSKIILKSRT